MAFGRDAFRTVQKQGTHVQQCMFYKVNNLLRAILSLFIGGHGGFAALVELPKYKKALNMGEVLGILSACFRLP